MGVKKLRVVQIHVQPVLVLDDGEQLHPISVQPVVVNAEEWPSWAIDTWPKILADTEAQLNAAGPTEAQLQNGDAPAAAK